MRRRFTFTWRSILKRLAERASVLFAEIFSPPHTRGRLLGLFLAVLELIKDKKIEARQDVPFGEIWLNLAPASAAT